MHARRLHRAGAALCGVALALCIARGAPALAGQDPAPRRVEVTAVQTVDLSRRLALLGRLAPYERATLVPRVSGYLVEIPVEPGDAVAAGDLLARLDVPDVEADLAAAETILLEGAAQRADALAGVEEARAQAAVAAAQVELRQAELEVAAAAVSFAELGYARVQVLLEQEAATQQQLEAADAELRASRARQAAARAMVEVARAQVAAAQARVSAAEADVGSAEARAVTLERAVERERMRVGFARLESPYERGLVARRHVDRGALVQAGETTVLEVMDVSRLRAVFDAPERDAPLLRAGLPVVVRVEAFASLRVEAELTRTHGTIDPMSGTLRAEVVFENDGRLLPGMFCELEIVVLDRPAALVVPGAAIYAEAGETWVMVAEAGVAARRDVRLGLDDGKRSEVLEGLEAGERVVLGRPPGLRSGDRIEGVLVGGGR